MNPLNGRCLLWIYSITAIFSRPLVRRCVLHSEHVSGAWAAKKRLRAQTYFCNSRSLLRYLTATSRSALRSHSIVFCHAHSQLLSDLSLKCLSLNFRSRPRHQVTLMQNSKCHHHFDMLNYGACLRYQWLGRTLKMSKYNVRQGDRLSSSYNLQRQIISNLHHTGITSDYRYVLLYHYRLRPTWR